MSCALHISICCLVFLLCTGNDSDSYDDETACETLRPGTCNLTCTGGSSQPASWGQRHRDAHGWRSLTCKHAEIVWLPSQIPCEKMTKAPLWHLKLRQRRCEENYPNDTLQCLQGNLSSFTQMCGFGPYNPNGDYYDQQFRTTRKCSHVEYHCRTSDCDQYVGGEYGAWTAYIKTNPFGTNCCEAIRDSVPNGKQICEGHGYGEMLCWSLPCCQYDGGRGECLSAVGANPCHEAKRAYRPCSCVTHCPKHGCLATCPDDPFCSTGCPAGYTFDHGDERGDFDAEKPSCRSRYETFTKERSFENCDEVREWVFLNHLDDCCFPSDLRSIRLGLQLFFVFGNCFLLAVVLKYFYILCTESAVKGKHKEAAVLGETILVVDYHESVTTSSSIAASVRFSEPVGSVRTTEDNEYIVQAFDGFSLASDSNLKNVKFNNEAKLVKSLSEATLESFDPAAQPFFCRQDHTKDVQHHSCHICCIRCAACSLCCLCFLLAPAFGAWAGLVFFRDVVGMGVGNAILLGAGGASVSFILFVLFRILRTLQRHWYQKHRNNRKQYWTCKERVIALGAFFANILILVLAGIAMWGSGPSSCMYCIRHIGKEHYNRILQLKSYCDRYVVGTRVHFAYQLCLSIFFIVGPLDMCIRVHWQSIAEQVAQEGPLAPSKAGLFSRTAWRQYLKPTLHRGEFITLVLVEICTVTMWFVSNPFGPVRTHEPGMCYRLAIFNVLIFVNRAFRIIVYATGVSLARIWKQKKEFDLRKVWFKEYENLKKDYYTRNIVRFQTFLDGKRLQLAFFILQVWFGILYILSCDGIILLQDEQISQVVLSTKPLVRISASFLCFVLIMELVVRMGAQGAELFFHPFNHKLEVVLLVLISLCFLYAWYFLGSAASIDATVTVMCLAFVVLHRIVRVVGIHHKVSASGFDSQNPFDAQALKMFETQCGDLFEVAPQNVHITFGDDIEIQVSKATLKGEAFRGLHLPIVPQFGLVEELHIIIKDQGPGLRIIQGGLFRKKGAVEPNTVKIKNLLILCGPGDGLASAQGCHRDTFPEEASYWDPDMVKEAKNRLVDLLNQRIRATAAEPDKSQAGSMWGTFKNSMSTSIKAAKNRVANEMRSNVRRDTFRHYTLDIKNVTFQFEDGSDQLDCGKPVVSAKIGNIWFERRRGREVKCEIARVTLRVETRSFRSSLPPGKSKSFNRNQTRSWSNLNMPSMSSSPTERWQQGLQDLDPQQVVEKLVRMNISERFRLGGFEEADVDSAWTERFPERHAVMTLLKVTASGKPLIQEGDSGDRLPSQPRLSVIAAEETSSMDMASIDMGMCMGPSQTVGTGPQPSTGHRVSFVAGSVESRESDFTPSYTGSTQRSVNLFRQSWSGDMSEKPGRNSSSSGVSTYVSSTPWRWEIRPKPLRFKIDDEQMRALKRIVSRIKFWQLRDNAFRWRPDVSPLDASPGKERSSVVWFWWFYAYHRVLASMGRRPCHFGIDIIWRAQTCRRYSTLLSRTAGRCKQGPTLRLDMEPLDRVELCDLQLKMDLRDIIRCRREVLTDFLDGDLELQADLLNKEITNNVMQEEEAQSKQVSSGPIQLDIFSEALIRSKGEWFIEVPLIEVRLMRWSAGHRPVMLLLRILQVTVDLYFYPNDEKIKQVRASMVAGRPSRVGRRGGRIPTKRTIEEKIAHLSPYCAVTLSVDGFGIICRAHKTERECLVPGGRRHICTVTKPVEFRPPSIPVFVAGQRCGKLVSLAARASISVSEYETLPIKLEFYLGELRCVYPVPLVLAVKQFFLSDNPSWNVEAGGQELVGSGVKHQNIFVHHERLYRKKRLAVARRKAFSWYRRLVGVTGRALDFDVDLYMLAVCLQRTRFYTLDPKTTVYVEDFRHKPYCGSFRRGTTADVGSSRLMTWEALFGVDHETGGQFCWDTDFVLPVWDSSTDLQEDQTVGSEEYRPSATELARRIIPTVQIKEGRLEREHALWRSGVSGHFIFPSGPYGEFVVDVDYKEFGDDHQPVLRRAPVSYLSLFEEVEIAHRHHPSIMFARSEGFCCPSSDDIVNSAWDWKKWKPW